MYPQNNLYKHYIKRFIHRDYSSSLPDATKRITLEYMNHAINFCDSWDACMDIGGGNGHYLTALSAKFKKAVLVEVEDHPEHKEIVKKYNNIEVANTFIEEYGGKEKVNFILLADIYEHIRDIESFVGQISGLQEKGGVVYVMTPNPAFCGPVTESSLYYLKNENGHVRHYPTMEICDLMKKFGYDLMFLRYEESSLRQKTKIIIHGLSRRDKRWSKKWIYRPVRPIILFFFSIMVDLLGEITYKDEERHSKDDLDTRTQDLTFKKMK